MKKHPRGEYADVARLKIASLAPAAARPRFQVTALDQTMVVSGASRLNIRDEPGGKKLGTLPSGASVEVTGETRHEGKRWYRLALAGGGAGYAFGHYLKDPPAAPSTVEKAVGVYPETRIPA